MVGSVCVMIRKAPYGTEDSFAELKLGLATIANGIETRVILMEDGVLSAVKNQNMEKIGMPSVLETIQDLSVFEVKIYCVEDHLKDREVKREDLLEDIVFIAEEDISKKILECDVNTCF